MNGPEHYREAERIITHLNTFGPNAYSELASARLAEAQVHATLALAAATALGSIMHLPVTSPAARQWHGATEPSAVCA